MKILKPILVASLLCGATLFALAAPPSKRVHIWPTVRTTEAFAQIHAGDKIAYVCKECDSVAATNVASEEAAMKLCKEGSTVECPSCKKAYRVVRRGPSGKSTVHSEIQYVNDEGKECMFITTLKE